MSVITYLKEKLNKIKTERDNIKDIDDNVTTDKYLRSLRREMRLFQEKKEKEFLKKKLVEIKLKESRRNMWGIKSPAEKRQELIDRKKYSIMQNHNYKLIRPAHQSSQGFIRKGNL